MCEAVRFIYEQETWLFFRPKKLALDETGVINETVAYVLEGKHLHDTPPCSTLEVYEEIPILNPVYIKEDVVESFMPKLLGSSGPGGMD